MAVVALAAAPTTRTVKVAVAPSASGAAGPADSSTRPADGSVSVVRTLRSAAMSGKMPSLPRNGSSPTDTSMDSAAVSVTASSAMRISSVPAVVPAAMAR